MSCLLEPKNEERASPPPSLFSNSYGIITLLLFRDKIHLLYLPKLSHLR